MSDDRAARPESKWLPPEEHAPAEIRARAELQRAGLSVERDPDGGVFVRGDGWCVRARTARQLVQDLRL